MTRTAIIAAFSLIALSAPALAQATSAQRAACTPDVFRLCSEAIPDVAEIKSCLRRERPKLSAGCRTVMDEADRALLASR